MSVSLIDVTSEKDLMGQARSGKGALGKVGQDAELLFPPLPRGDLGLLKGWSRVLLAEAPPGTDVFPSWSAERKRFCPWIAASCVHEQACQEAQGQSPGGWRRRQGVSPQQCGPPL